VPSDRVVVVGAGVAGLVTAIELAARGLAVTVLERADHPGGKLREVAVDGARLDAGPTVFTMRWVFDELFATIGEELSAHLNLRPAHTLARHAWSADERLDLFADIDQSADAIGTLAGAAEASGYRAFCEHARRIYRMLEPSFVRVPRPTLMSVTAAVARRSIGDLRLLSSYATLWQTLGEHFHDPRLRQLFGRYATYSGSSPFQAPAQLMLIAHVEQEGVWLVEGGMHRIAVVLAELAAARGAVLHYGAEVAEILTDGGRACGVRLADGEQIAADAVVVNAEAAAVGLGLLGQPARRAMGSFDAGPRSLSAVTWSMLADTTGFPLMRHTVFFSDHYQSEFDDIFEHSRLPTTPTVYVCAQDRDDTGAAPPAGTERLFCLVNAPPTGDSRQFTASEIAQCEERTFGQMERCGLTIRRRPEATLVTTPTEFATLFPATGGALYGRALHSSMASFQRPAARTRLPGLYLTGGSTHPGPGVPMVAMSGRLAAASLLEDLASNSRSRRAATRGGMLMR
jgi:1-hydroxycarotenoid 3,4-desaturase